MTARYDRRTLEALEGPCRKHPSAKKARGMTRIRRRSAIKYVSKWLTDAEQERDRQRHLPAVYSYFEGRVDAYAGVLKLLKDMKQVAHGSPEQEEQD